MKAELTENSVKLISESDFEKKVLIRLRSEGVGSIRFEDDWDQKGALILSKQSDSWDPNK